MKFYRHFCSALLLLNLLVFSAAVRAQSGDSKPTLKTHALKINVDDMKKAVQFYMDTLGFEIEDRSDYPKSVYLKTNDAIKLILYRVKKLHHAGPLESRVSLTLQVNDLAKSMAKLKANGVKFDEAGIRKEAVGDAIYMYDPFGRRISLMHQTIVKDPEFKEPKIYNFGLIVPDMAAARDFYENKLGFVARTEKYLPLDMPLGHADKTFGFMLHYREGVVNAKDCKCGESPYYSIVFAAENIDGAIGKMFASGLTVLNHVAKKEAESSAQLRDPFGNVLELVAGK